MSDSKNDKATKDIGFIEKLIKVAWVLYGLALFFYAAHPTKSALGTNIDSEVMAMAFIGLLFSCIVLLAIWRFQHREAALARLRGRWIKCLVYVGAMSALVIGPILLGILFGFFLATK
jgi:hypothetical protein